MIDIELIKMAVEDLEHVQGDINDLNYTPMNEVKKEIKKINETIKEAVKMIEQGIKES